ncbi:MAG: acyl-CoA dehydrogenase family protein [Myxococcota bacterium]
MFDLDAGEELDLVVETARAFANERLAPRLRDAERTREVDPLAREAYREIGLAGLELPEALGGAGLGAVARVRVNEELAAADAGAAVALDPLGPALYPLLELGGASALQEWALPRIEAEQGRAVLVTAADVTLEVDSGGLSGRVPWVPADRVDLLVWLDAEGAAVMCEGWTSEALPGAGLRAAGASSLSLERAPIAARFREPQAAARALARARLYQASLMLGVLRASADFSRGYALERVAFGRPIAHHQALAFLIADMQMALDGARLLIHEAAWRIDRDLPCAAHAAAALCEVIEASRLVGPNGVQLLGGHGFMQDYPVEKYMRESRILGLTLGGIDAAQAEAARALCSAGAPVILSEGGAP